MKLIFQYVNVNKSTFIADISEIKSNKFQCWRLNRPVCEKTVDELVVFYEKNQPEKIDGEIFCGNIKGVENLQIFDGQHRIAALRRSNLKDSTKIILTIIEVQDDHDLFEHFRNINKMRPLCETDLLGNLDISGGLHLIAKEFCDFYPKLQKMTRTPRRPFFNRDEFVDSLYRIYEDSRINNFGKLKTILKKMNDVYRNSFIELLNEKKMSKTVSGTTVSKAMFAICHDNGCYIFLSKKLEIDIIQNLYILL